MIQTKQAIILEDTYSPLPQQSVFHRSQYKYRCYLGGLGSGKTHAGSEEAKLSLIEHPGLLMLIARQTYPELRDTTMRTFFSILPEALIKTWNKSENHLILKNGSEVIFRSLDDPMKLKSLELGAFWIDEASETEEEILLTLQGRLRQKLPGLKPFGYLTTNPPNVGHWIEKYFIDIGLPSYHLIKATTYENSEHLPEGYIQDLEKNYPASWIKKYLYGEFGFTSAGKPVYPMFIESQHVRDLTPFFRQRDNCGRLPSFMVYRGWDFGFNFPAVLFSAVDSKGRWLWLKEFIGREMLVNQLAEKVKFVSNNEFPNCQFQDYCDPAGNQRTDKNEKTSVEILRAHKIFPISRMTSPLQRSETVGRLMQKSVDGLPALMVHKDCKTAIDALAGGYHFKKPINNEKFQQDNIEKDGFYDHIMDAAGYISTNLFDAAISQDRPKAGKIGNWKDYSQKASPQVKNSVLGRR